MSPSKPSTVVPSENLAEFQLDGAVLTTWIRSPRFGHQVGPEVARMVASELEKIGTPVRFIVLDFAGVEFISSAGFGACLTILQHARERGAQIVVHGLLPQLRDVFEIMRMETVFKLTDSAAQLEELTAG